jgi:SPP1 gp7 family putative phage head morphogenesis protein
LAHKAICECCKEEVIKKITKEIAAGMKEESAEEKKKPHAEFFEVLFKSLASHERRFRLALKKHWEEEERIILANLKKLKKEWLTKQGEEDIAESILFSQIRMAEKLSETAKKIAIMAMTEKGDQELARLGTDVSFDIASDQAASWLESYFPKFAKEFEKTSVEDLKKALIEGIKEGEDIRRLTARVQAVFDDWSKTRAYMVARSETLRASNKGSLFAMRQSGVVKKRFWITYFDDRTCVFCEEMDGKVIDIEENFFDEGDEFTIERGDKEMTMSLDYEDVDSGNLHPLCRCTIGTIEEE